MLSRRHPSSSPVVQRWLYLVATLTFCLIVFGGFVRLSRAGLSIVEWNPIVGVLPPIGDAAWAAEFSKYQRSPEYEQINVGMTLDAYRRIFYIEWAHRLIARLAGLAVLAPLALFLWRGLVPWRRSAPYIGIALLFGLQGALGWFMVSSGLVETPAVSHYRLTAHLLVAMLLLAVTMWVGLNGSLDAGSNARQAGPAGARAMAVATLCIVTLQIAWGGLTAGLKAGHVSYTWPLMGGAVLPAGLLDSGGSWWATVTASPAAVHWIHRWLAWGVVAIVAGLVVAGRRATVPAAARRAIAIVATLVGIQVVLGIGVLWFHVPVSLALLHQAVGLAIFAAVIVVNHRVHRG